MRTVRLLIVLAFLGCAGCGPQAEHQVASTSTPLTAPSLQPPTQGPDINPKVSYDPCTMISDAVISKAGYNPATRKRYAGSADPPTIVLGCEFEDDLHGIIKPKSTLEVASSNENIDADRKYWNDPPHPNLPVKSITVNGRAGFEMTHYPAYDCYIYLPTKAGDVAIIWHSIIMDHPNPCDGVLDIAKIIEPTIGENR
ncbi:DUF3558 domain-containing protein [Nocardia macrotermitis]|nr:DUF3558 domain-containing protein [Nocardia macrotermitis]